MTVANRVGASEIAPINAMGRTTTNAHSPTRKTARSFARVPRKHAFRMLLSPIGWVRSSEKGQREDYWGEVVSEIVLDRNSFSPEALDGLSEFSRVEVLFQLHGAEESSVITGRRPPLQTPSSPTIPDLLPAPLVYYYSASVVCFYSALDRGQATQQNCRNHLPTALSSRLDADGAGSGCF